jgi:glycogen debranching enzyme
MAKRTGASKPRPAQRTSRRATGSRHSKQDSGSAAAREQRVLKHGFSTTIGTIGAALTTKAGNLAVICDESGDLDAPTTNAHGLYFHDMRFLDREALRVNGERLTLLLQTDEDGWRSIAELTNPDLRLADGNTLAKERIGIRRTRTLSDRVNETLEVHNFSRETVELSVELTFAAAFADIFTIRGAQQGKRGTLARPTSRGSDLEFRYHGADGRTRSTAITFDPAPDRRAGTSVAFSLRLAAGATSTLALTITLRDEGPGELETAPHATQTDRVAFDAVQVTTSSDAFNRLLGRSFTDLRMLLTHEHGDTYLAAGVPWYIALFGRDSLVASFETLAYDPEIARTTLRVLAKYQGSTVDHERDEQPGKILHEFRVGEKANLHEIPQYPYYGTVDATPLFLVLFGEYLRWTGDRELWRELRHAAEAALRWIDDYGDSDGDGFIDYQASAGKGLDNQGWKDSGNSITNRDGSLATAPIALVEVQGYVYRAWLAAAELYEQDGDAARAADLRTKAKQLCSRFRDAYWMTDRSFLAVALQQGGRQAQSLTSNAGQALWSGIVADEHAAAVAATLLGDSMFSGWGIRTLGASEAAYNPLDYQVGSIWPHDNALIAAGLRRYGQDDEALKVFSAIVDAATRFPHGRLPEVFAGFDPSEFSRPVHYPVACQPQAWASGALPYLLQTMLGLEPDALHGSLRVVRPVLPSWLNDVSVRGLRVGGGQVDLDFHRGDQGTAVEVVQQRGELTVEVGGDQRVASTP